MSIIGLDLGATKLAGALFADDGALLHRHTSALEGRGGSAVGALICESVRSLMPFAPAPVRAVGICVPGISWHTTGRVWAPNIPGWEDYPLAADLEAMPENAGVRIHIDSDRACSILGEVWQGAAKGCRDAVFMAVGTGIGLGIMADGNILRGAHDIAGAIGWLALQRPFRTEYVGCGCYEYHASGAGLAKVARQRLMTTADYRGKLRAIPPERIAATDLFSAYEHGDPIATEVIDDAVAYWGMATANVVSLFNPEVVVFGGGIFGPAGRFLSAVRNEAIRWAQPISMQKVRLEISRLGTEAALFGAAYLTLQHRP